MTRIPTIGNTITSDEKPTPTPSLISSRRSRSRQACAAASNVHVTFKPTNSIYIFYRLTDPNNIASVGPVSFTGVRHAGRNTGDYPSAEVQEMAQLIATEFAKSFLSPLEEALAAIRVETKTGNVTHLKPVSFLSIPPACCVRSRQDPWVNSKSG
jgi:hypothetical protein